MPVGERSVEQSLLRRRRSSLQWFSWLRVGFLRCVSMRTKVSRLTVVLKVLIVTPVRWWEGEWRCDGGFEDVKERWMMCSGLKSFALAGRALSSLRNTASAPSPFRWDTPKNTNSARCNLQDYDDEWKPLIGCFAHPCKKGNHEDYILYFAIQITSIHSTLRFNLRVDGLFAVPHVLVVASFICLVSSPSSRPDFVLGWVDLLSRNRLSAQNSILATIIPK